MGVALGVSFLMVGGTSKRTTGQTFGRGEVDGEPFDVGTLLLLVVAALLFEVLTVVVFVVIAVIDDGAFGDATAVRILSLSAAFDSAENGHRPCTVPFPFGV